MGAKPPSPEKPLAAEERTKRFWDEGSARAKDRSEAAIAHCRLLLARWLSKSAAEDEIDAAGKGPDPSNRSGP